MAKSEDTWTTISENRSRIVFDTVGDVWEGYYEGPDKIADPNTEEVYDYLNFRDEAGDGYMVSASYQLSRAFADVPEGTYVRLTVTGFTDTRRGRMTNFKVQRRA
jgi:hypothetical protein